MSYDFAVGYRPGARFAPKALRGASGRYAIGSEGFFNFETETHQLQGINLVDAGDVDPAQLEYRETFQRFTEAARKLRKRAKLPIFIGGDHSVSYPVLKAYDELEDFSVLQFDAHLDYSDSRNGTRFANSSPSAAPSKKSLG